MEDFKGLYKGAIDYNLTQYTNHGVPIQAEIGADGKLINVDINGSSTDASAATMISDSSTESNGVIRGQASYNIPGIPGIVNTSYSGNIDIQTGVVNIVYNMSGGISGSISVYGTRVQPIANADIDQSVKLGTTVTLNGNKTTPNCNQLDYKWTLVSAPTGSILTLTKDTTLNPIFTPDVSGDYVLNLQASYGKYQASTDSVTITALAAPIANAGLDQPGTIGIPVSVDDHQSHDANNLSLSYRWSLIESPYFANNRKSIPTLINPNSAVMSFVPELEGAYEFNLVVNNGNTDSISSKVNVNVRSPYINNNDGTATDSINNIVWELSTTYHGVSYWEAFGPLAPTGPSRVSESYCDKLTLAGYADWRIPTLTELENFRYHPVIDYAVGEYWAIANSPRTWAVPYVVLYGYNTYPFTNWDTPSSRLGAISSSGAGTTWYPQGIRCVRDK